MSEALLSIDSIISDTLGENYIKDDEINEDKLLHLLNTSYSNAFNNAKNGYYIFRGDTIKYSMSVREPGIRISKDNGLNFYNRLFSNILSSWLCYPKRNSSFICTSDRNYALEYNKKISVILPINNTKIGVCPQWTMWHSFTEYTGIEMMDSFNKDLGIFLSYFNNNSLDEMNDIFKFNSNKEIRNLLNNITMIMKKMDDEQIKNLKRFISQNIDNVNIFYKIIANIFYNDYSLVSILSKIFNPSVNQFGLIDISEYQLKMNDCKEIWFDNRAIFVDIDYLKENYLKHKKVY